MKPRITEQRNCGLTLHETLVIIAGVFVLAIFFLPISGTMDRYSSRINCVSNLKQVNLSLRIWEADNNNEYPMAVSVTNGGGKEFIASGDVADCLRGMSNEMSTTKIFICPEDKQHVYATNFGNDFNDSHISYFFGADVSNEDRPQMILDGDDNFTIDGIPQKAGLVDVSTNALAWGTGRHEDNSSFFRQVFPRNFFGNIGLADGSVLETSALALRNTFAQTGVTTNRIAIP